MRVFFSWKLTVVLVPSCSTFADPSAFSSDSQCDQQNPCTDKLLTSSENRRKLALVILRTVLMVLVECELHAFLAVNTYFSAASNVGAAWFDPRGPFINSPIVFSADRHCLASYFSKSNNLSWYSLGEASERWHCSPANPAACQSAPISAEHSGLFINRPHWTRQQLASLPTKCTGTGLAEQA